MPRLTQTSLTRSEFNVAPYLADHVYTYSLQNSGWSTLFFAAQKGNVKIVQLLVARGAKVDRKDKVSIKHRNL